jgi:hypothetical protein
MDHFDGAIALHHLVELDAGRNLGLPSPMFLPRFNAMRWSGRQFF